MLPGMVLLRSLPSSCASRCSSIRSVVASEALRLVAQQAQRRPPGRRRPARRARAARRCARRGAACATACAACAPTWRCACCAAGRLSGMHEALSASSACPSGAGPSSVGTCEIGLFRRVCCHQGALKQHAAWSANP